MFKRTLSVLALLAVTLSPAAITSHAWAEGIDVEENLPRANQLWWPNRLDLSPLRHDTQSNPLGNNFNYAQAFNSLDLNAVKKDIAAVLTQSQDWWPADYGNYGPFFIRMAWHSAGTYRQADGRGGAVGGQQRFEPLNSWPDNVNLDKARRLLWPIKQKYGEKISWGDLMVLTGNVSLEQMGFKPYGFAGGRDDDWEPDLVYWGPEVKFLDDKRHTPDGTLKQPLAATQMGLIYVNPEGPHGNPDPVASASSIRQAFGHMGMNDEETVALIAGGHTFGKAHGAAEPSKCTGPEPAAAGLEEQGFGWHNKCGTGNGDDTISSGLEGAWSASPTHFTMQYFHNLFAYDYVLTKSPAGASQWAPKEKSASQLIPDAQNPALRHPPMMFTTDIALKTDPSYKAICERFQKNPEAFKLAFAKAWFKLTHRDMGPRSRYLGPEVPSTAFIWQDPVSAVDYKLVSDADVRGLKQTLLNSGLTVPQLVGTAWASASTYRDTDMRGGANGARIQLAPEKDWAVNNPQELQTILAKLTQIQTQFNASKNDGTKISLADLIVLGGSAGVEQAAKNGGYNNVVVPFTPGRADATQAQTDVKAFAFLEPKADGFRNFYDPAVTPQSPVNLLVDKASTLHLTVPEMTVLLGGLRSININTDHSQNGVFTQHPGALSNDYFVNLLSMSTKWSKSATNPGLYDGVDRKTGQKKYTGTPVDLIFGSNSELRAVSEVYAYDDAKQKFITDFVAAWTKVINNDRFDLHPSAPSPASAKAY